MSNKRSKRNNNKVLKALRQKRANGGRTKKFYGGSEMGGFSIPTEEQIRANIQRQQQGSGTTGSEGTSTIMPVSTPADDPRPVRSDFGGNIGGKNAYNRALAAWKARNGQNPQFSADDSDFINVTEGSGGGSATDIADSTAPQGNTGTYNSGSNQTQASSVMSEEKKKRLEDTAERTEQMARGEIEAPKADVAKTDGSITTAASDVETIADRGATERPDDIVAKDIDVTTGKAATAAMPTGYDTETYTADKAEDLAATKAAQGEVSVQAEVTDATMTAPAVAAERDTAQEQAALAGEQDFEISEGAYVDKVTGKTTEVAPTPEAEKNQREAITGQPATAGQAAEIIGIVGYEQIKNRSYSGREAAAGATNMLSELGNLPTNVSTSIVEDPATVEAQLDQQPVEVRAAVAALPTEALVSSQMESLLAGMEDGKTPAWARPAVAAIEQKLAQRGLSASTVGRDALFNAIIQSALPMAQSNAQALQQRAAQNLSNEQQANLTQSTQDMQRRMANLANRQTAEGQTAQYAQQMSVLQSQFTQQGVMAEMQVANDFLARNAGFQQQMNLANLSNDQQMQLANLSALNQASSENLTAEQQTDLANLNTRMQTNLLQANLAQQMGIAQLNVDQQRAVQNAAMTARVDLTKFSADQQTALANSKFMQSMTMADFNANQQAAMQNATAMAAMDMQNADARTKVSIQNAQNFLAMDMANLNNRQQASILDQQLRHQRILSDQAASNAAKQFNAASENQTNQYLAGLAANMAQFNTSQTNAMTQFNASEANRASALEAQNQLEADKANADIAAKISTFDAELQFRTDQWNAANAQAVEQSNIEWRRKSNTINTAAQNAANQQNASFAFNMSTQAQAQLWQELRDQATFDFQASQADIDRKVNVINAALGNESLMTDKNLLAQRNKIFAMLDSIR